MNTYAELVLEYGMNDYNAQKTLAVCNERIGTQNGDYVITDVTYIGNGTKDVEEKCVHCGNVIHRKMVNRKNKWSELQRVCDCQREKAKEDTVRRKEVAKEIKWAERYFVLQNEVGKTYGEYVVVQAGETMVLRCAECGAERRIGAIQLMSGQWKDQICHVHRQTEEKFNEKYIGRKNNMLEVIGITHSERDGRKRFICKCDCGKICHVKPTFWENGKVKSCGCWQENRSIDADEIMRIKGIYRGMCNRCGNPNNKAYGNYGGRGIQIDPRWAKVEDFIEWSLKNGYENTKTIDRIDPNGNYCPENCRWTTYYIQNRNKRPSSEWKRRQNG